MSEVATLRRYYVLKRIDAARGGDLAISAVWQSKQEAAPAGVALSASFPNQPELAAVGYEASEDLKGADCLELSEYAGLSERDAQIVIAAVAAL